METNNAESLENSTKNTVINKQNEEINLLSLSVVRRDGSITPFKSDKIANAIRKAFLAQTDLRDSSFNVKRLIAPSIDGPYYTYDGSLTTPGCDEIVDWILFRKALLISSRQIEKFRTILDTNGEAIENNFRPIQPLNSRIIYQWVD